MNSFYQKLFSFENLDGTGGESDSFNQNHQIVTNIFIFHLRFFHLTVILNESWSHEEILQEKGKETFSLEMN